MFEETNNTSFSGSAPLQIRLDPDGRVVAVEGEAADLLYLDESRSARPTRSMTKTTTCRPW